MAEIEAKTKAQATATPGSKSQFDVLRDGEIIFSKQSEGRFPESEEILLQLDG